MQISLTDQMQIADSKIRSGNIEAAREILSRVRPVRVPREKAAELAQLYRRCGFLFRAARLLFGLIYRKNSLSPEATLREKSEYAMCLIRLGSHAEGERILQTVALKDYPLSGLFFAHSCFQMWDYERAIPVLEKIFRSKSMSEYDQMLAEVNLIAAYVATERMSKASRLHGELLETVTKKGLTLLRGNLLELEAQIAIGRRDFRGANKILNKSLEILSHTTRSDTFFVKKWQYVCKLHTEGFDATKDEFLSFRDLALSRGQWETVRDCDYYLVVNSYNEPLFRHLYFGTPYEGFRARLMRATAQAGKYKIISETDNYLWHPLIGKFIPPPQKANATPQTLSLGDLALRGSGPVRLSPTSAKILLSLSRDFYRPVRLLQLSEEVFEGDHFNPNTTPGRIRQAIYRCNQEFASTQTKIRIVTQKGTFRIRSERGLGLLIPNQQRTIQDLRFAGLLAVLKNKPLSVKRVAEGLHCSKSTALRDLSEALKLGIVAREGIGKATKYRSLR